MWKSLRSTSRNPPALEAILYTRAGCHLCDDALVILHEHGLQPQVVDIDRDPDLQAEYDCCVPVVKIDGRVRFRGKVNVVLLRRLLQNVEA